MARNMDGTAYRTVVGLILVSGLVAAVAACGLGWTLLAASLATRGSLINALRNK